MSSQKLTLFLSDHQELVTTVISNKAVQVTVTTLTEITPTMENRFGVSLEHAKKFITAFKNHKVKGYNVCHKYALTGQSASIHAHTFLWSVLDYKVLP